MTGPWDDPRAQAGLRRQMALRHERLGRGEERLGWKVGFGAPASLELLGITAPLVGFLTDATLRPDGATVDTSTWDRGVVEFEVAVYIGADLAVGADATDARSAVAAVGPAIELANIDLTPGPEAVAEILAGNIFHEVLILGRPDPGRAGLDISGLEARVIVDGADYAATSELEALTGRYPEVVATVATTLATQGERLRAGDVIITGSVFPPVPVGVGRHFEFRLHPLTALSVTVK